MSVPSYTYLLEFFIQNIKEYEDSSCSFSFIPLQKVYDDVDADSSVSRIQGSLYDNKILAISGINASGKTSLLSLIEFMLEVFLCNQALNADNPRKVLDRFYDSKPIVINVLYSSDGNLYRIISVINKQDGRFVFEDERILRFAKSLVSKRTVSDMANYINILRRTELSMEQRSFLESDKSIIFASVNESDSPRVFSYQESSLPDSRMIQLAADAIIPYLDSSIERINVKAENLYCVYRRGRAPEELSYMELISSLSSGTLRGIGFFARILTVLKYGGYLLVDEIEDNLNKTIVVNIIELFMRKKTNPHGAHIVFTTHYQELLDILARNDSIYITTRDPEWNLVIRNLAEFLKRRDVKRSDLLFSNYYDLGTAVDYSSYINLKRSIEHIIGDSGSRLEWRSRS